MRYVITVKIMMLIIYRIMIIIMIMTIQSKLSPHISAHTVLQSSRMKKKRKNMN